MLNLRTFDAHLPALYVDLVPCLMPFVAVYYPLYRVI
jgi:hypothetical protein